MRTLNWQDYLDKVYGCFLGKAVVGTMGAPFEGVKMPMAIPFSREMISAMLPNDDLDLQILWLDVCEDKGPDFTSADLLARFCEYCSYSPGEYAVMRRNYQKGIQPPISGIFGNDNYIEGMGCPIRSEIWACLAPGDGDRAADYAGRDGCLDHAGASVSAERFLACLEAEAFFESDLDTLIQSARRHVPSGSRLDDLIKDTLSLCAQSDDVQWIFRKIHRRYGHPDCTNMYQNIGITLTVLKKCGLDFVKAGMTALNCGFDTDCTCATVGAILGTLMGAKAAIEKHDLGDVKYVLSVRAKDRGDRIESLSRDVALLGLRFMRTVRSNVEIVGAPDVLPFPAEATDLCLSVRYENDDPAIAFGQTRRVFVRACNRTARYLRLRPVLNAPDGFECRVETDELLLSPLGEGEIILRISCPADGVYLNEKNLFSLSLEGDAAARCAFGLSGSVSWKVVGPYWETAPSLKPDTLVGMKHYSQLLPPSKDEGEGADNVRQFHLNYFPNVNADYVSDDVLFAPLGTESADIDAERFDMREDALRVEELFGMTGPCAVYLSRIVRAPEDMEVCLQVGHSCPFRIWLNGQLIGRRDGCDRWTNENVHLVHLKLHQGDNPMVVRLTRVNDDAKISLTFSKGPACSEYITSFACKNPARF